MAELKDFLKQKQITTPTMSCSLTLEERTSIFAEAAALNTSASGYLKALHRLHMANKEK